MLQHYKFNYLFLFNFSEDGFQPYELEMKEFFSKFTLDVIATCAFGMESNSLKDVDGGFASRVSKFASLSILKRLSLYIVLLFMSGIARYIPLSFFNMEVIDFLANVIKDAKKYRKSTGQKFVYFLPKILNCNQFFFFVLL